MPRTIVPPPRRRNHRHNVSTAAGAAIGIYAIVAFVIWLIVMAAIVAIAGDVIGFWNAVEFV